MAKLTIPAGATSQSVPIFIQNSGSTTGAGLTGLAYNTASLTAYYVRTRGAATSITLATLAAATSAWSSGGFKEIDATNMPGWYRLDIPDACLAAGVRSVGIQLKGAASMAPVNLEIDLGAIGAIWDEVLTGANHNVANSAGKILRLINPNSDAIYTSTLPSQAGMASNQVKLDAGASAADDAYGDDVFSVTSGTGSGSLVCSAYNGTTKVATFYSNWPVQPVAGDTIDVTPSSSAKVIGYATGQDPASYVLVTAANKLETTADGGVTLADGVAHGGTPGASTATFAGKRFAMANDTSDPAFSLANSAGDAFSAISTNAGSRGMYAEGGGGAGSGFECYNNGNNGAGWYAHADGTQAWGSYYSGAGTGNGWYVECLGAGNAAEFFATTGKGIKVTSQDDNAFFLSSDTNDAILSVTAGAGKSSVVLTPGSGGYGLVLNGVDLATLIASEFGQIGSVDDASATAGEFTASVSGSSLSSDDAFYKGQFLMFRASSANAKVARKISDYQVTGDVATFSFTGTAGDPDEPFPDAPADTDRFLILGRG
jgi:hypothetical protein